MSKYLKKGDNVCVISGNDKGRTGTVLGFKKDRVIVQGVNVRKKHVKRTSEEQGAQILDIECPIDASNIAICDQEGKKIKLKVRLNNGKKDLIYMEDGKEKIYRNIK